MGKRRKSKHTQPDEVSEKDKVETPRCFIIKRGTVGERVKALIHDFRQVMSPNCAQRLRESRHNRIEDFVAVAGHFHVTHIVIFSSTKTATWMKVAKIPQGPTLTFKVDSFSLARDIRATQKRPRNTPRDFLVSPLQVLNGFGGFAQESVEQLTSEMLRGLFPAVDVPSFSQASCTRTALFHMDREKELIQFRHYSVAKKMVGVQRGITKLMRTNRPLKLGHCSDIADFVLSGGVGASESELDEAQEVPTDRSRRVGVRLVETGPRITMQLVKAEEGLCNGNVLYHRFRTTLPTPGEIMKAKLRQKQKLEERNNKLTAKVQAQKAQRKAVAKRKRERQAKSDEEEDVDAGVDDAPSKGKGKGKGKRKAKGGGDDEPPSKKQRFHPFAWGSGRRSASKAEGQTEATAKQGKVERTHASVLDKFHRSAKR